MPRLIRIYDSTRRDGTQGEGASVSMEDKLRIAARLDDYKVRILHESKGTAAWRAPGDSIEYKLRHDDRRSRGS